MIIILLLICHFFSLDFCFAVLLRYLKACGSEAHHQMRADLATDKRVFSQLCYVSTSLISAVVVDLSRNLGLLNLEYHAAGDS